MDRRRFLLASLAGALAVPFAAGAQEAGRVPRVGLLQPGVGRPALVNAFRQGLRDLGYVEGQTLIIEFRIAREPAEQNALLAELVSLKVDALVTWTTPAALAAKRATSTIPIVAMTGDPTQTGLATSLARPGRNVTGVAIMVDELEIKKLQLLREAVPSASHVAVIWNADNPVWAGVVKRLREVAPTLGVKLHELPVTDASHFESGLRSAAAAGVGALLVVEDSLFTINSKTLAELVANYRLPAIYHRAEFIDLGGLLSYSVDLRDMLRRLAGYVDKILRGATPGDLPIANSNFVGCSINRKAAKALGLTIPPSLLARADQVIE
jgi:putative tryptophan/tyrosine transport system substrate-binding protein